MRCLRGDAGIRRENCSWNLLRDFQQDNKSFWSSVLFYWNRVSNSLGWLELAMYSEMTLSFWSSCLHLLSAWVTDLFYRVLGIKSWALCLLGKHSTNWTTSKVNFLISVAPITKRIINTRFNNTFKFSLFWMYNSVVKFLPRICKTLCSIPSNTKLK